jgi:hypothetical protein
MATYRGQLLSSSIRRLESNPKGPMVSAIGTATRISSAAANHLSCWRSTPRARRNRSARARAAAGRVARNSGKPTWPKAWTSQPSGPPVMPIGFARNGWSDSGLRGAFQRQRDRQEQDQPGQRPPAGGGKAAVGEQQQHQREQAQAEDPGEVGRPGGHHGARQGAGRAKRP